MTASENCIELIKKHEGLRLEAYKCPSGVLTIGYGHTRTTRPGMKITTREANILLCRDIALAERAVTAVPVSRPLKQCQFDALVCFVFNVGTGNFHSSTLRAKVSRNPGDPTIKEEFKRWIHANGKVLPGLVKRRADEANLYFSN